MDFLRANPGIAAMGFLIGGLVVIAFVMTGANLFRTTEHMDQDLRRRLKERQAQKKEDSEDAG